MLRNMSEKTQLLFCMILNTIWKYTKSFNEKTREMGLLMSVMMISISAYIYTIVPIYVHLLFKCIIGVVFMMGIILFSLNCEIKKVEWNTKIFVLWFGFGILRLISGVVVSLEYLPLACIWLVGFPFIFLIWNNRGDYEKLFNIMYKGFMYPTLLFFILSILFVPIRSVSYTGMTGNPNSVGQHIAAIFPLAVGKYIFEKKEIRKERLFDATFICICVAFAFFSSGRTIMVVMIGVTLVAIICQMFWEKGKVRIQLLKEVGGILVGSILAVALLFGLNKVTTSVLPNYEYKENIKVEKNVELGEVADGFMNRMQGKDKAKISINDYSSGRIGIWVETIKSLNLQGHSSKEHIYTVRNGNMGNNVHNVFLQFAYDHGIFAGIVYVLLAVVALWGNIKLVLYSENRKKVYVTSLLVQIAYLGVALFTSINLPFLYEISFVYYITYAVLFVEKNKELR